MNPAAAFGFVMWLGGVAFGVGIIVPNYSLIGCGSFLSITAIIFYYKFI